MKFWSGDRITKLEDDYIFVFGSNPEGRHGKGAAKDALKFGAKYGIGRGLVGNTYALVTKNLTKGFVEDLGYKKTEYTRYGERSVSPEMLLENIKEFYECAMTNQQLKFFVVYQATSQNLNGYSSKELWDLFTSFDVPENVYFHDSFKQFKE